MSPIELPSSERAPAAAPSWIAFVLLALALTSLALALHFAGQGSLWRDEATFADIVAMPSLAAMLSFLVHGESHPPLFYLLLRGWTAVFGASDTSLTVPSALCALALAPATYWVGRRVFSWQAGVLAAAVAGLSPLLLVYGGQVRPYTLLPLLMLGLLYGLYEGLHRDDARAWLAHALFAAAALLTHNWSAVVVGTAWGFAAIWLVTKRAHPGRFAAAVGLTLALYAAWLPSLLFQIQHAGYAPWPHGVLEALQLLANAVTSVNGGVWLLPVGGVYSGALVAAIALPDPAGSPRRAGLLRLAVFLGVPLAVFLVSWALSWRSQMLIARVYMSLAPAIVLVAAEGLARLSTRQRVPWSWALAGVVVGYLALDYAGLHAAKSNASELAQTLGAQVRASDLVLVSPGWEASSFNRYFTAKNEQIDFPTFGRETRTAYADLAPRLRDPSAYRRATEALAHARASGRRVWVVTATDEVMDGVVPVEGFPADLMLDQWGDVGEYRTNQLLAVLLQAYGAPVSQLRAKPGFDGIESLVAFLFAADVPTGKPQKSW